MAYSKRTFLAAAAGTVAAPLAVSLAGIERVFAKGTDAAPGALAVDEPFWASIRKQFAVTHDFIQLENGYYSITAQPVLDAFVRHAREVNATSSYYMRTKQVDDKLAVRHELARLLGCADGELIITRNTTESLDTVINGFDWKAGDEAVMAEQDYGSMLDMFKLQARRHGIVNRIVSMPMHPKTDDEIVDVYERALTPKTRLLMVCHMINITGQILPVKKIVAMAHARDVQVMVDGAHTFGQLDFRIDDIGGCDYYGSSLHKWLGAPLGSGILYVRKDRIKTLWQMFGDATFPDDDIRKLNHTGTHPAATDLAILDAIRFHDTIGSTLKAARLRHLQRYWTDKVRSVKRIVLNTPDAPERSCAIANVGVEGVTPAELAKTLLEKHRIFTVAIDGAGVHGVRVTPQLFTTTIELDALVKALTKIAT
jgi:selenocysteine lyase/cysteine desulfurase